MNNKLNVKHKPIKKIHRNLGDLQFSHDFFRYIAKHMIHKRKNKLDFIKTENFCYPKDVE